MISCYQLTVVHPRGERPLFDEVSLEVEAGVLAQIVGAAGAGKSVLFEIASLRRKPRTGRLVVAGRNLDRLDEVGIARVRRSIGSCAQYPQLIEEESVAENLMLPLVARGQKEGADERVASAASDTPLEELLEMPAGRLAHAERRLVGIWRALIGDPQLVLIDGGLSGLGDFEQVVADKLVAACERGATVVAFDRARSELLEDASSRVWRLAEGRLERLDDGAVIDAVEGAA
ncbi:MAG: ATP-binding cassette domain-containing protein [Persicimonas sp.]